MQQVEDDGEKTVDKRTDLSRGSTESFEELVAQYDRKVYNLALRLVRNPDDAWDVTQETFVRAFRSWDGFEGRSAPYTWLCQIAINLCRNRARDREHWSDEPVEVETLESSEPTPEAALQSAQLSERIRRAIDSLPGDYRVVSVLRDLQGLTYQEIAEAAGISVELVKTRLARARAILRRKLDGVV
nr:sigma-70 family RNA polymerase sigma factor [Armatimonadota bacterium]